MKYAVKALSNGRARAGVLQLGSSCGCPLEIETPSLLLPTRKGLPLFISPDLLPSLPSPDSRLLQFSPLHFLEGLSTQTIKNLGGLHQMLGLHEYGLVAVPRDSIQCLPASEATNKVGPSFETPCGRCLIKPKDYMEMISSMRPDIWVTLADEVPTWVSEKRNSSSVGRTIRWLDECIALRPLSLGQNKQFVATRAASGKQPFVLGSSVDVCLGGDIFGSIVGGANVQQRQQCAEEVAKRNVSGYWIGGFGLGESMDERPALLKAVCDNLPEEKPRLVCGLGLPEEVLQGVAAGIDLFDTTYIYHITIGGFALTFPIDEIGASELIPYSSNIGSDQTKINLRATVYRKDVTPIVQSCSCYTCKNHTKAYINHLLNVHEMLAQTLLEIHNTHHFLGFFRLIRAAIKEGKFEQFREKFIHDRREHLAVSAVHA